jgi:hypothetical protein
MHIEPLNYIQLYLYGLDYGKANHLAALPTAYSSSAFDRSVTLGNHSLLGQEGLVTEALHPMLKNVFKLDMALFVDICYGIVIDSLPALLAAANDNEDVNRRLQIWYV